MKLKREMVAGVEGGGTTWVCAVAYADSPEEIVERASFATEVDPAKTLSKVSEWLMSREFSALGIASFGPIDVNEDSETFGFITMCPKPGWQMTNVVGALKEAAKGAAVAFDTDVNAPAYAEYMQDPSKSLAYVTVGTGVGVGLVVNGEPVHGLLHPEAGHVSCPRYPGDTMDTSGLSSLKCQDWHEVEANVASRALARRAGLKDAKDLKNLPDTHEIWHVASHYLAAMAANLILVASPQKIIFSGGVMQRKSLFPKIRTKVVAYLNGYVPPLNDDSVAQVIVPSRWKNDAGIIGALFLASNKLKKKNTPPPLSSFLRGCAAGALLTTTAALLVLLRSSSRK